MFQVSFYICFTEGTGNKYIAMQSANVSRHGCKYGIMISPWLDARMFKNLDGQPDINQETEDRYATAASRARGAIAELYDFVPATLHKLMKGDPQFANVVRTIALVQSSVDISLLVLACHAGFSLKCGLGCLSERKSYS